MSASQDLAGEALAVLERLYITGTHSDLLIRSARKGTKHYQEFKVHKCIVYPVIPIFESIQIKNREFTIIKLKEPKNVVDAILRYVYKMPWLALVPRETDTEEELREKASLENVQLAIELRKAAAETQFDLPALLPQANLIIGNALLRTTLRTFTPEPVIITTSDLKTDKCYLEWYGLDELTRQQTKRYADRKRTAEGVAADRPLVELVHMILALEEHGDVLLRIAAMFALAMRMPEVVKSIKAKYRLKRANEELYRAGTKLSFEWLEMARKGDHEEERRVKVMELWKMCAKVVGGEWTEGDLEEWVVFQPGRWGDGMDSWWIGVLEEEEKVDGELTLESW